MGHTGRRRKQRQRAHQTRKAREGSARNAARRRKILLGKLHDARTGNSKKPQVRRAL